MKYFTLIILITLCSCGVKPPQNKPITKAQAESFISNLAGTIKPEINLYHTYGKTRQRSEYWDGGLTSLTSTTSVLTISKIDGNYVEGTVNSRSDDTIESPSLFFGRFDDTYLYIFITAQGDYWPKIYKYEITENSKKLIFREFANYNTPYSSIRWRKVPELNVRHEYDNPRGWSIYKSTGYVSQTDNSAGKKRNETNNNLN